MNFRNLKLDSFGKMLIALGVSLTGFIVYSLTQTLTAKLFFLGLDLVGAVFGLAMAIWVIVPIVNNDIPRQQTRSLKSWRFVLETIATSIAVRAIPLVVTAILHLSTQVGANQTAINHTMRSNQHGFYFTVILVLALAPAFEEFIFRWLPGKLVGMQWWCLTFFGFMFTLMHSPTTPFLWLNYGVLALGLEIMAYRWGTKGSVITHFLFNATAMITLL